MPANPVPPPATDGPPRSRLARRAHELHPELSFSQVKRAVIDGKVTVGGEIVRDPGAIVSAAVRIELDANRESTRDDETPKVELVYVDEDVAVAVKPAGLLSVSVR